MICLLCLSALSSQQNSSGFISLISQMPCKISLRTFHPNMFLVVFLKFGWILNYKLVHRTVFCTIIEDWWFIVVLSTDVVEFHDIPTMRNCQNLHLFFLFFLLLVISANDVLFDKHFQELITSLHYIFPTLTFATFILSYFLLSEFRLFCPY